MAAICKPLVALLLMTNTIAVDPPQTIVERGGDIELPGEIYLDREYVYGPDYVDEFIAQFDRDGHAIFMLQDGNYNVVVLVSGPGHPGGDDGQGNPQPLPTGTVLEQYTYEPYGALIAAELYYPHAMNRAGHQGLFFERFDGSYDDYTLFRVVQGTAFITGAKGLYYNRNRFYSPSLGRFTTRDPNETALPIITAVEFHGNRLRSRALVLGVQELYDDGLNLFLSRNSRPVSLIDPTGLFSLLDLVDTASLKTYVWVTNSPLAMASVRIAGGIVAAFGMYQFLVDTQFREDVLAQPNLYNLVAMDIRAILSAGGAIKGLLRGGGSTFRLGTRLAHLFADPGPLKGLHPAQAQDMINVAKEEGWLVETLRRGSHEGQGLMLRQVDANGNTTGRIIQWHPGGGHHGPNPYWKVSSGEYGTKRVE